MATALAEVVSTAEYLTTCSIAREQTNMSVCFVSRRLATQDVSLRLPAVAACLHHVTARFTRTRMAYFPAFLQARQLLSTKSPAKPLYLSQAGSATLWSELLLATCARQGREIHSTGSTRAWMANRRTGVRAAELPWPCARAPARVPGGLLPLFGSAVAAWFWPDHKGRSATRACPLSSFSTVLAPTLSTSSVNACETIFAHPNWMALLDLITADQTLIVLSRHSSGRAAPPANKWRVESVCPRFFSRR